MIFSELMIANFEGQLCMFTNVVKGWQYRRFVLDTSSMVVLEYYLLEEKDGARSQEMEGALVISG